MIVIDGGERKIWPFLRDRGARLGCCGCVMSERGRRWMDVVG